jgi:hypothetical protein
MQGIIADTSGGAFTVTLPASPTAGTMVSIVDGADWGTNNLTVARNGATIEGLAEDLVLNISSVAVDLIYSGTTWQVYAQVGGTSGDVVTVNGTQTLTNKTIAFNSNTLTGVQPTLVSGTNIKTINGGSVLGSGDLAVGGGSLIFLQAVTASNSATVVLENGVGSTYDDYVIIGENISCTSITGAWMRVKVAGSYLTTSIYKNVDVNTSGGSGASSALNLNFVDGDTHSHFGVFEFFDCNNTSLFKRSRTTYSPSGIPGSVWTPTLRVGIIETTSALQGFRFEFQSGNVVTGTFRLYGIKKS